MVNLVYRFTQEGFAEFERQLVALGPAGQAALAKVKAAMPEFADAFDKAKQKAEEHRRKLEENAAAANSFGAQMGAVNRVLGVFGVALSATAVVNFATDLFKSTAALEGQSRAIGVGIEQLQAYRGAAVLAGDDIGVADAALQRFTRTIGQANESAGQQREAFINLGLSANDLAGGTESALPRVASALLAIKDEGERARLMTVLFGQAGQNVVTMLEEWADPDIIAKMNQLGLVIDESLVKRAADADAAWKLFWERQKVNIVGFTAWLAENGPPNPWDWALDPNDPRRSDNFAGPDTTRLAGMYKGRSAGGLNIPFAPGSPATAPAWVDDAEVKKQQAARDAFERSYQESINRLTQQVGVLSAARLEAERKFTFEADREGAKRRDDYARWQEEQRAIAIKTNDEIAAHYSEMWGRMLDDRSDAEQKAIADSSKMMLDQWGNTLDSMFTDWGGFLQRFLGVGGSAIRDLLRLFRSASASAFGGGGVAGGSGGGLLGGGLLSGIWGGAAKYNPISGDWIPGPQGFGGGGFLGQLGGLSGILGNGLMGAGVGSMVGGLFGGNSTGSTIGGAIGGIAGNLIPIPVLGPLIGSALGGAIGGLFGGKPSNYRAGADFGAGMGSFSISGDKPNENTLGLAQQAAAAIMAEVQSLKAFGVEFQQQLANIWIGQRDESTYQFAGGQRVGVGSVGNAGDLAQDTIAALLKGATSSDPTIAAVLKSGAPDLLKALQFAQGITDALGEIEDPLQHALDLWQKAAAANVAMAEQSGYSLDKIAQYNAELYRQTVGQVNAPVISGIEGYLTQLSYGPQSTASPGDQYARALVDYEASKAKASSGTAADAAAYLQATQSFLPFAKGYLGVSKQYESLQTGAIATLNSLADKLAAPKMPDLVTPIVQGAQLTVEAVNGVERRIASMEQRLDEWNGRLLSLMGQLKPV